MQWLGQDNRVIFNTREAQPGTVSRLSSNFRSTNSDLDSGETTELPLPIYVVAPDGTFALTVNYARFWVTHRTIGYAPNGTAEPLELAPKDEGITRMDLTSGETRLLLSLADLREFQRLASMEKTLH